MPDMRVLVLTQGYPSAAQPHNMAYVHVRVRHYQQAGWELDVLSFGCQASYSYEEVQVQSEAAIRSQAKTYDIVVSHAPNLRNHIRFLLQNQPRWQQLLWVIHGHEVLLKQIYYPRPYDFDRQLRPWLSLADRLYDEFKVRLLKKLITHWVRQKKLRLICVSNWIKQAMKACIPIETELFEAATEIIQNPIHPVFLSQSYQPAEFWADFVTVRPLDQSKYAIDMVVRLAELYPDLHFDVYGRGQYFEHHPPPANLRWQQQFFAQHELPELFNHYPAALMPTRQDTQGVINCELASYGIPVLTTDIEVCHEMLDEFENVHFFDPQRLDINLRQSFQPSLLPNKTRFSNARTIERELKAIASWAQGPEP